MFVSKTRLVAGSSLLVLLLVGSVYHLQAGGAPLAPKTYPPESPHARGLDANLYMQTSAEYRACCYQAYNLAALRLKQYLNSRTDRAKPPAVIMDLDETVFDNAGFQASQLRSGLAYDSRLWGNWEEKHSEHIGLIPGARRFIFEATQMNVTVVFVSNRSSTFTKQAKAALERFEIPIKDDGLLKLNTSTTGNNDKTGRFQEVKMKYDVLLFVGDNLRDFDEQFKCPDLSKELSSEELESAIQTRKDRVDQVESNWGDRWIILPNPSYGEWTRPLMLGDRDYDRLVKPEK